MSNPNTLAKIEAEIAEGKLGIARDRLHGLVNSYPEDLSLRSKLGDVYWKLGYPIEAGRWWFFHGAKDEVKQDAIAKFVKSCDGNKELLCRRLKVKDIDLSELPPERDALIKAIHDHVQAKQPKGRAHWGCALFMWFVIILLFVALVNLAIDIVSWIR